MIVELRRDVKDLRDAILGTPANPGIVELLRDHEKRISRIEAVGLGGVKLLWDRVAGPLLGAAAGYIAAHFPGTRP